MREAAKEERRFAWRQAKRKARHNGHSMAQHQK